MKNSNNSINKKPIEKPVPGNRLNSLDALRGLDMFFLVGFAGIFRALPKVKDTSLNNWLAGQCSHAEWHGFTAYDLVFPLFIFIVGVAIPLSFKKRLRQPGGKGKLMKHVLNRVIVLAILGAVLWGAPWGIHPSLGFYSVLFRIGVSYLFASLIFMHTGLRGQIGWAFGLVIGHWLLMRFFPVPGYGMGDYSAAGNVAAYFRDIVSEHISPSLRYVFHLNLIPSISNALFGVLAGRLLLSKKTGETKTKQLLLGGILLMVLAFLVHLEFPINKRLTSPSFVFLTCGISALLLGIFYWVIDVKGCKKWAFFFIVVGVNPITIYVADFLVDFKKVANVFVGGIDFGNGQALAIAIASATIKWLFLYYFYKQKVFLKI